MGDIYLDTPHSARARRERLYQGAIFAGPLPPDAILVFKPPGT